MRKAAERPEEGVWLAIEREVLDTLTKRRRLREKTTVKRLKMRESDEEEDEGAAQAAQQRMRFTKVVEEEMKSMLGDDAELISEEIEILAKMKKLLDASEKGEDDEILQTKIVSPYEVSKGWADWIPAVDAEVNSLLREKEAMEELRGPQLEELLKEAEEKGTPVEFLPSKLVFTKKPGKKGGRYKVRWVICGNFEQKKDDESTYSSGADASALRLLLVAASMFQWSAGTIDVKTAFLNALMDQKDHASLLLVKPPSMFLEKKYMKPGTYFLPRKAVYGLRRSPKLWGDCRDDELDTMELELEEDSGSSTTLRLSPLASEPNLWRIESAVEESDDAPRPLRGLLMTYVDDILVAGDQRVVKAVMEKIRKVWSTSEPDEVGIVPIRFLGVEISKVFCTKRMRDIWYVSQQSYVRDLLSQESEEIVERKVPITKDQSLLPEEGEKSPELIKAAQKATGEMLWLVTRTRPDLMYAASKMGSCVTKAPEKVLLISKQIKGYLKRTQDEGLRFDAADVESLKIEAMSDASFAPDGDVSHGAFIIQVGDCPVFWRSGRQSFVTLSTAEAEMMEIIESMVAGESIGAIADELFGPLPRKSWTDSQSAQSILTSDGGSWRTRHLRLRASAARSSILQGSWFLQHMAGTHMTADIGTKPLTSERIKFLKDEMHLVKMPRSEEEEKKEEQKEVVAAPVQALGLTEQVQKTASVVRLITLAAAISLAKGQEGEDEEEERNMEFHTMMVIFAIVIVLITLVCQYLWKVGVGNVELRLRSQPASTFRSLPAERVQGRFEEKEKEEKREEVPRPAHLPLNDGECREVAENLRQPVRLPSNLSPQDGESREVAEELRHPVRLPSSSVCPEPRLRVERDGESREVAEELRHPVRLPSGSEEPEELLAPVLPLPQEELSSSSEEEPYRPLDERHIPVITEQDIERAMREMEEEEAALYAASRVDQDQFRTQETLSGPEPFFRVWTTRYGQVYHHQRECRYLMAPQTGTVRESEWCWLCRTISLRTRGRPPPGVSLWIDGWGQPYHVDSRCPRCRSAQLTRACQACDEQAAG